MRISDISFFSRRYPAVLLLLFGCLLSLRSLGGETTATDTIAVTTTLLETAVRELLGEEVSLYRLLPPGSCPGHFDIAPQQVAHLLGARIFVRHDFQKTLEHGLLKAGFDPGQIVVISSRSALTIPTNYLAMCEELADRLVAVWPEKEQTVRSALANIRQRAKEAEEISRTVREVVKGRKVICAKYQKEFCQWLGLDVVAVFQADTDESAWQLARAVDMARTNGATAVVGNLQWGPKHLAVLTEALKLPGIMLSNFPASGAAGAYWQLLESNLKAVKKAFP